MFRYRDEIWAGRAKSIYTIGGSPYLPHTALRTTVAGIVTLAELVNIAAVEQNAAVLTHAGSGDDVLYMRRDQRPGRRRAAGPSQETGAEGWRRRQGEARRWSSVRGRCVVVLPFFFLSSVPLFFECLFRFLPALGRGADPGVLETDLSACCSRCDRSFLELQVS